jgi:precorrin-6A/cobalt-precorrin-6A reductase
VKLLILGGTSEASALAGAAVARFGDALRVISSLAGRTASPAPVHGEVRIGGFGGATGLAAYLRAEGIGLLVDATHPFADQMSRQARVAAEAAGVPRLMLQRPPWKRHPDDRWIETTDLTEAARAVRSVGRRAFLTVGSGDLAPFAPLHEVHFLVRLVDPPRAPLPLRFYEVIVGRGPFALADERHIMARHGIDVLVTKASGGAATEAKLVAARESSLPVVMVRRPPTEPGERVETIAAALDWIAARLGAPRVSDRSRAT